MARGGGFDCHSGSEDLAKSRSGRVDEIRMVTERRRTGAHDGHWPDAAPRTHTPRRWTICAHPLADYSADDGSGDAAAAARGEGEVMRRVHATAAAALIAIVQAEDGARRVSGNNKIPIGWLGVREVRRRMHIEPAPRPHAGIPRAVWSHAGDGVKARAGAILVRRDHSIARLQALHLAD